MWRQRPGRQLRLRHRAVPRPRRRRVAHGAPSRATDTRHVRQASARGRDQVVVGRLHAPPSGKQAAHPHSAVAGLAHQAALQVQARLLEVGERRRAGGSGHDGRRYAGAGGRGDGPGELATTSLGDTRGRGGG